MPLDAMKAHEIMDDVILEGAAQPQRRRREPVIWEGSRYEEVKKIPSTTKGNMAEDLLVRAIREAGYTNVEVKRGRRGDWDVKVENAGKTMKFESKIATQDTSGKHQFNGIRHDTDYTHLFLLGVRPNEILYKIIAKRDRDEYTLTPMRQSTNSDFKITLPNHKKDQSLNSFDEFEGEVKAILGEPV